MRKGFGLLLFLFFLSSLVSCTSNESSSWRARTQITIHSFADGLEEENGNLYYSFFMGITSNSRSDEEFTVNLYAMNTDISFSVEECNTADVTMHEDKEFNYTRTEFHYFFDKNMNEDVSCRILMYSTKEETEGMLKVAVVNDYGSVNQQAVSSENLLENSLEEEDVFYRYDKGNDGYVLASTRSGLMALSVPEYHFGKKVISINKDAFKPSASSISFLALPETISALPNGIFNGFSSLISLTIPFVGNEKMTTSGKEFHVGRLFGTESYANAYTITYNSDTYQIPSGLSMITVLGGEYVPDYAFSGFAYLSTIKLPDETKFIGSHAFYKCYSMAEIHFPSSLTGIGISAFELCQSLVTITLPSSLEYIETNAFLNDQFTYMAAEGSASWYPISNGTALSIAMNPTTLCNTYAGYRWESR